MKRRTRVKMMMKRIDDEEDDEEDHQDMTPDVSGASCRATGHAGHASQSAFPQ